MLDLVEHCNTLFHSLFNPYLRTQGPISQKVAMIASGGSRGGAAGARPPPPPIKIDYVFEIT